MGTLIHIDGVPPYDGRYELNLDREFTTREWGWIKRLAGYLPMTIGDGFDGADPELFAVFATIALTRAGRVTTGDAPAAFDRIVDAPFGSAIRIEAEPEEGDDERPPPSSSNGSDTSSGDASKPSSVSQDATLQATGVLASGSSGWPHRTSPT